MMDPDHELFVAVADEGSLAAAGRRLSISPAMVSKRIARLEDRLGAKLMHRTTRRLSLTGAGERLLCDLRAILVALDEAERRVTGASAVVGGPLHVSAPTSFGRMHLAPWLPRFLADHPRVELTVDLSDRFVDMLEERCDLAIRITADPGAGVVARRLATNRRILCAAPDYLDRFGTPAAIADLKDHRLLAADGQMPWRLAGPNGPVTIEGRSHVRTNSSELVRELALAGGGVALRSLWDIADALRRGTVRQILPEIEGSTDVGLYAVHLPQANPPRALTAFVEFLAALYGSKPPWDSAVLP